MARGQLAKFLSKDIFSFFRKTEKKSAQIAASGIAVQDQIKDFYRLGGDQVVRVSPSVAYQLYNNNSAVADATRTIAESFAMINPVIIKNSGEIVTTHPVLQFLKNPNTMDGYKLFSKNIASDFILNGNAYLEVMGNVKSFPIHIWNVKNDYVSIAEMVNSAVYTITATNLFSFLSGQFKLDIKAGRIISSGTSRTALREIYHIKEFYLSESTLKSISRLNPLFRDTEILKQSDVHNAASLTKGFSQKGFLGIGTDDDDVVSQVTKDISQMRSGAGNAHGIIVHKAGDMDYKSTDMNNRDMQLDEIKKDSRNSIYRGLNIPGPLVDGSAQKYQNYQTALYALFDSAVIPLADSVFDVLTSVFQDRGALKKDEIISFDLTSVTALQLRLMEELKARKALDIESTNELRAVLGKEPISGGDDILVPLNKVPIGRDQFTEDQPKKPSRKSYEILKKNGYSDKEIQKAWRETNI